MYTREEEERLLAKCFWVKWTGEVMDLPITEPSEGLVVVSVQHSPLSWPMADWFMEECMMLSDWTLGGRGGIWLPATWDGEERKHF